ncbi:MAG: hypothetical protein BV456_10330 [Thermoplasmata archaeon M8B2D]|nr:MAG: hypothetical protein BV456_10330 [Thermoplasmata archaeon M8B2D]
MFKEALDFYNLSCGKKLKKSDLVRQLVKERLFPSMNYGNKVFKRFDSKEQTAINPDIIFRVAQMLEMEMGELYKFKTTKK